MMYQEKFVAVVKTNGAILREKNGSVILPFGSDYSLLLKNLDSRKAVVNVSVDGKDVLGGNQVVINGNSQMELEGFMEDSVVRNKFRFIQKTEKIVNHRGDKLDDGMIRVEYRFEKSQDVSVTIHHNHVTHYPPYYSYPPSYPCTTYRKSFGFEIIGLTPDTNSDSNNISCFNSSLVSDTPDVQIDNDEGITVAGAETNQQFTSTCVSGLEENSHVIILKLCGTTRQDEQVVNPITIKTKLVCPTCGTKSRSDAKFCSECSTALVS